MCAAWASRVEDAGRVNSPRSYLLFFELVRLSVVCEAGARSGAAGGGVRLGVGRVAHRASAFSASNESGIALRWSFWPQNSSMIGARFLRFRVGNDGAWFLKRATLTFVRVLV